MDIQLKRGVLEACVLKILSCGDSYGYQIIRDVMDVVDLSESTLYPILRRLEAGGYLTVYSTEHNGRLRKYYSITDSGREHLHQTTQEIAEVGRIYQFLVKEDPNEKG